MAYEVYYCGMCGRETDGGLCSGCSDRYDRAYEEVRDRMEREGVMGYHDPEIHERLRRRFNIQDLTARYCQYLGSCGNRIEDGGDICPSCREKEERRKREEEEHIRDILDDI